MILFRCMSLIYKMEASDVSNILFDLLWGSLKLFWALIIT